LVQGTLEVDTHDLVQLVDFLIACVSYIDLLTCLFVPLFVRFDCNLD